MWIQSGTERPAEPRIAGTLGWPSAWRSSLELAQDLDVLGGALVRPRIGLSTSGGAGSLTATSVPPTASLSSSPQPATTPRASASATTDAKDAHCPILPIRVAGTVWRRRPECRLARGWRRAPRATPFAGESRASWALRQLLARARYRPSGATLRAPIVLSLGALRDRPRHDRFTEEGGDWWEALFKSFQLYGFAGGDLDATPRSLSTSPASWGP